MTKKFKSTIYIIIASFLLLMLGFNFHILKHKLILYKKIIINSSNNIIKTYNNDYSQVFSKIYSSNVWGKGSGIGSDPENAKPYLKLLQQYINDDRFHTIIDLGCGDWQIMQHINIPDNKIYHGYDVVNSVQQANLNKFAKPNIQFYVIQNLADFKKKQVYGDLLIVKDVLQHWPNKEINYFFKHILPNFKYALITNSITPDLPSSETQINSDIYLGEFRPIRLLDSPFNWENVSILLEYPSPEPGFKQVLFYKNPKINK